MQEYEPLVNKKGGVLFSKRSDILSSLNIFLNPSICISTILLLATFDRPLKSVEDRQGLILAFHRCSQLVFEFKAPSASTFFVVVQGRLFFCSLFSQFGYQQCWGR